MPAGAEQAGKGKVGSLRHVLSYLRAYRLQVVGAFLALIVTSSTVLAFGTGLRYIIDQAFSNEPSPDLIDHSFIYLLIGVFVLAGATYSRYYLVSWIGEKIIADIRRDVYARLVGMDVAFFEVSRTGDLVSRLMTDTTLLQTVIGSSISVALRNLLMMLGGLAMMFFMSPSLSIYIVGMVPIVVVPIIMLGREVRKLSRDTQERTADVSAHAEETIASIRTIQALALEKQEQVRFQQSVGALLDTALTRIRKRALLIALVIALVLGAICVVLWLGSRHVMSGEISSGDLSAFLFYAMLVATGTGAISEVVGDLQRAAGATERLMELKHLAPTITAPEHPVPVPSSLALPLHFDGVRFAYPARPGIAALDGVSFTIEPGETVALVGPSGAGKSTVMQLLLRFYDVQSGRILVGETPLMSFDPAEWRGRIGLVPQDPVIFSTTAYENIRFGRSDADATTIRAAARQAEALEFIEALPDGFDTYLGERGVRLSGGQRQRLAIARALVRNPQILLLDEATSALDSENERKVQLALEQLMKGRTTLVIAHRLSTVQNADRILVMDHGHIVAQGTHAELIEKSELYHRLAKRQFEAAE